MIYDTTFFDRLQEDTTKKRIRAHKKIGQDAFLFLCNLQDFSPCDPSSPVPGRSRTPLL
jgi:hypothetical protein